MKPLSGGLRSRKSKLGLLSTLSAILLRRDRLAFETKGPIKTAVNKSAIRSKRSRPRDDKGGSSEPRSRPDGLKRMERIAAPKHALRSLLAAAFGFVLGWLGRGWFAGGTLALALTGAAAGSSGCTCLASFATPCPPPCWFWFRPCPGVPVDRAYCYRQ